MNNHLERMLKLRAMIAQKFEWELDRMSLEKEMVVAQYVLATIHSELIDTIERLKGE